MRPLIQKYTAIEMNVHYSYYSRYHMATLAVSLPSSIADASAKRQSPNIVFMFYF